VGSPRRDQSAALIEWHPYFSIAASAFGNKTARVAWALLAQGGTYRRPALAAAQ
jgi:hypothetical protein